jgi:hypothetical protein
VPSNYLASTSDSPAYYTAALKCSTTNAPEYYTTAHVALSYSTEYSKYYSSPSDTIYQRIEYYVEVPEYYITKAPEYKNGRILHRSNHR